MYLAQLESYMMLQASVRDPMLCYRPAGVSLDWSGRQAGDHQSPGLGGVLCWLSQSGRAHLRYRKATKISSQLRVVIPKSRVVLTFVMKEEEIRRACYANHN